VAADVTVAVEEPTRPYRASLSDAASSLFEAGELKMWHGRWRVYCMVVAGGWSKDSGQRKVYSE
jgi:hypothetical protein